MTAPTDHALLETPRAGKPDPVAIERRSEARYPTHDPAEIRILPLSGPRLPATVVDVSRSGLRLELATQLARGLDIEIVVAAKLAVFGEVRYSRRVGVVFHAGVRIRDVHYVHSHRGDHIADDQLHLYVSGSGLKVPEVIRVRDHLRECGHCQIRFQEWASIPLAPGYRPGEKTA